MSGQSPGRVSHCRDEDTEGEGRRMRGGLSVTAKQIQLSAPYSVPYSHTVLSGVGTSPLGSLEANTQFSDTERFSVKSHSCYRVKGHQPGSA